MVLICSYFMLGMVLYGIIMFIYDRRHVVVIYCNLRLILNMFSIYDVLLSHDGLS